MSQAFSTSLNERTVYPQELIIYYNQVISSQDTLTVLCNLSNVNIIQRNHLAVVHNAITFSDEFYGATVLNIYLHKALSDENLPMFEPLRIYRCNPCVVLFIHWRTSMSFLIDKHTQPQGLMKVLPFAKTMPKMRQLRKKSFHWPAIGSFKCELQVELVYDNSDEECNQPNIFLLMSVKEDRAMYEKKCN